MDPRDTDLDAALQASVIGAFTPLAVDTDLTAMCRKISVTNVDSSTCYIVSVLFAFAVATQHGMWSYGGHPGPVDTPRHDSGFINAVRRLFVQPIMEWVRGSQSDPPISIPEPVIRELRQAAFDGGWLEGDTDPGERHQQQCALAFTEFVSDVSGLENNVIVTSLKYEDGSFSTSKEDTGVIALGLPHQSDTMSAEPALLQDMLSAHFDVQSQIPGLAGTMQ